MIMTETAPKRCYYLDLAKVFTAFLVVFGHLYSPDSPVRLYLYSFHMPLFFLISGIFHKYSGKINWDRYARTILWPILIFIILESIVGALFYGENIIEVLRKFFVNVSLGSYKGVLWFLFALFWCKVYQDFFCGFRNKVIPVIIWGCLLFVPLYLFGRRLPFSLSQGLMGFPFYAIGFLGKDYLLTRRESFRWGLPFVLLLILNVLIVRYLQGRVSMVGTSFGNLGETLFGDAVNGFPVIFRGLVRLSNYFLFYLNGLIGSAMILSLSLLPFQKTRWITSLSMSLITVLGTQYLFINVIEKTLGFDNSLLISTGLSIGILFLCYLMHLILKPAYDLVKPRPTTHGSQENKSQ